MRHFFRLPLDEKNLMSYRAPVPRGYSGINKENFACLSGNKAPNDIVEKFRVGPAIEDLTCSICSDSDETSCSSADCLHSYYHAKASRPFFFPNRYPSKQPDVQVRIRAMYSEMFALAKRICCVLARAFDLPPQFFLNGIDELKHTSIFSVNHYPVPI